MFKKFRKNEKGFTLAELLIVVAIIGFSMPKPILLHIPAVHFQPTISHPIPLSVLVILSNTSFARRLFFQTMEPCGKTHLTKSFCGYLDNLGSKSLVSSKEI